MALKSTIFKAELQIADLDRNYFQDHRLTLARHPSETDERMMIRLLAFVLNAHEDLQFTPGLSTTDQPDLWQKDMSGVVQSWIEIGQPDEKRIRKAVAQAQKVLIYCYSGSSAEIWWGKVAAVLKGIDRLSVINIPNDAAQALAEMAQRQMQLQFTIQEGQVWVSDGDSTVEVEPVIWQQSA